MDRELDGVYFRIQRENEWQSVCFSDMTEEQMIKTLDGMTSEELKRLCIHLGRRLKEVGDVLDIHLIED